MTTSGSGWVSAWCFVVAVVATLAAAGSVTDVGAQLRRPHPVKLAICLAVALPSVLGIVSDAVYDALYRDPDAVRGGEPWRLVTGSVVQDGGAAGTVFNLVVLWLVVSVALVVWGSRTTVVLLVVGVLAFNAVAAYLLDAPGGGNSGPTLFLAATVVAALARRTRARRNVAAAAATLLAAVVLVATLDAHGLPLLAGLLTGAALA